MRGTRGRLGAAVALLASTAALVVGPEPGGAATFTEVTRDDAGAAALAPAMVAPGTAVDAARFLHVPPSGSPHAIADVLGPFPVSGGDVAVLTTGAALAADDPDASGMSGTALGGGSVRGDTDFDVTVLRLDLVAPAGTSCLRLNFAFFSEEFPEFVGSPFNDAFVAELGPSTWTTTGATIGAPANFAAGADGLPIRVSTPGAAALTTAHAAGTTYDGATPVLEAAVPVEPGAQALHLSLFDQGDQAYDSAVLVDNVRFDAGSTCTPGARPVGPPPLVLVPDIGASALVGDGGGELWPRTAAAVAQPADEFLAGVALQADGVTDAGPSGPVRASEVLTTVDAGSGLRAADVTRSALDGLAAAGYRQGVDLFPVPLDWRRSTSANATRLLGEVDRIRSRTGSPRVDLVAHGQGGLVALEMLRRSGSTGRVRRAVTLGTPVLGTADALGVLELGMPCLPPSWGFCLLDGAATRGAATNFPGVYDLLPSRGYHDAIGVPLHQQHDADGDGAPDGAQSYDQWLARVKANRNAALADAADAFHATLDTAVPADPAVRLLRVAGDGVPTPAALREWQDESCVRWFSECAWVVRTEAMHATGDGVVPLPSASLHAPERQFDRRNGVPGLHAHGVPHRALPGHPAVLDSVVAFLRSGDTSGRGGVDGTPGAFSGLEVEVVGAAGAVLRAADGARAGVPPEVPAGVEVEEIPGASFTRLGGASTFAVTRPGSYALQVTGAGPRHLLVRVRRHVSGAVADAAAFHVPAPGAGAAARLDFDLGQSLGGLRLAVDRGSDGIADEVVVPTTTAAGADRTSPRSAAMATRIDPVQVQIELRATDGASGVAQILYLIEGEAAPRIYTGPFTTLLSSHIQFRAVDHAGNVELIRAARAEEILSDDVPNNMAFAQPLAVGDHVRRFIAPVGDQDWFMFEATGGATYRAQLYGLRDDYDLELYDANGQLLAAPRLRGSASEEIRLLLPEGRHYLRVVGVAGAWSAKDHYQLKLQDITGKGPR